jgi:hypothetical protein
VGERAGHAEGGGDHCAFGGDLGGESIGDQLRNMARMVLKYLFTVLVFPACGQTNEGIDLNDILLNKASNTKEMVSLKPFKHIFDSDTLVFYDRLPPGDTSVCDLTILTVPSKKYLWLTLRQICKGSPVNSHYFPCSTFKYRIQDSREIFIKNKCGIKRTYRLHSVDKISNGTSQYTLVRLLK